MGGGCDSITLIWEGEVSVRRSTSPFRKTDWSGERAGWSAREVERVEVVVRRLHLAAVDDLVAEPEEDVLDLAADLRDQVEMAAAGAPRPGA